jgi:hypothetical protein
VSTGYINLPETGGSGANPTLSNLTSPTAINQNLLFGADNSFAIGALGASRPSEIYVANQLYVGSGPNQVLIDQSAVGIYFGDVDVPNLIYLTGTSLVLSSLGQEITFTPYGTGSNTSDFIEAEAYNKNLGAQSTLQYGSGYTKGNRFWSAFLMNELRVGQGLTQGQIVVGDVAGGGSTLNVKQRTNTQLLDLTNSATGVSTVSASTTVPVTSPNGVSVLNELSPGDRVSVDGTNYYPITGIIDDATFTVNTPIGNGTSQPVLVEYSMFRVEDQAGNINLLLDPTGALAIGKSGTTVTHIINGSVAAASSGTGTLTNLPSGASGNPGVFLKLNINGTVYVFPGWTV